MLRLIRVTRFLQLRPAAAGAGEPAPAASAGSNQVVGVNGTTIAGGVEARLEAGAGGARVLIIEVLAAGS